MRHLVSPALARRLVSLRSNYAELRRAYVPVKHESSLTNVFHCCVHKTGSQWLMSLFSDVATYRYSGLYHYNYHRKTGGRDPRTTAGTTFDTPFPAGTIVSPLYMTYENFQAIPKLGPYRAIFVMRDPRDLLTSWYFSARDNHIVEKQPDNPLYHARERLRGRSQEDGLLFALDYWRERGRFQALESWAEGAPADDSAMLVRYEDLGGEGAPTVFSSIFEFFDIALPDTVLADLLEAYSFRRLSGRDPGTESSRSHLRSGRAGDWEKHFTPVVRDRVEREIGDLITRLGY